jgi:hypothetical protein
LKIKQAISKAAEECIGYKKLKNYKWLRMWNEKIELATEKMKASYRNWGNFGMSSAMTVKEE